MHSKQHKKRGFYLIVSYKWHIVFPSRKVLKLMKLMSLVFSVVIELI